MKEKLFQIFSCLYFFWYPMLSAYLNVTGREMDGMLMRVTLVCIAAISWLFYLWIPNKGSKEKSFLMLLVAFGVIYYSTQFFHSGERANIDGYNGQFLRWGADCVSAGLIGMTLTKLKSYNVIHKYLPLVCLAVTPCMAIATITMGSVTAQLRLDSGMNYQTIAYTMAVLFCCSFFYTFIYKGGIKLGLVKRIVMMAAMLLQAVCCAMSGGRGGLVLLIVYVCYMCYILLKNHIISMSRMIFLVMISAIGFFIVADYFGLWNSVGFQRSSNSLNDDDRFLLWAQYLPYIKDNLLLGNGLGGDYFTCGFYSHNIIIDWLVETGVLGTSILMMIFYKSYKLLYLFTLSNQIYIIVMIFFIYGLVMNMFSGYWITTNIHWMVFGIIMSRRNLGKCPILPNVCNYSAIVRTHR